MASAVQRGRQFSYAAVHCWSRSSSFYPASKAFVGLSQATLMDSGPNRHEQNMTRWTFAGSLGVVAGPIALSTAPLNLGWRGLNFAIQTEL